MLNLLNLKLDQKGKRDFYVKIRQTRTGYGFMKKSQFLPAYDKQQASKLFKKVMSQGLWITNQNQKKKVKKSWRRIPVTVSLTETSFVW